MFQMLPQNQDYSTNLMVPQQPVERKRRSRAPRVKQFNPKWMQEFILKAWINPCPTDPTKVDCLICFCSIRAHKNCLIEHARTGKHRRNYKANATTEEYNNYLRDLNMKYSKNNRSAKRSSVRKYKQLATEEEATPGVVPVTVSCSMEKDATSPQSAAAQTIANLEAIFKIWSSEATQATATTTVSCKVETVAETGQAESPSAMEDIKVFDESGKQGTTTVENQSNEKISNVSAPNAASTPDFVTTIPGATGLNLNGINLFDDSNICIIKEEEMLFSKYSPRLSPLVLNEMQDFAEVNLTLSGPIDMSPWEIYPNNNFIPNNNLTDKSYFPKDDSMVGIVFTTAKEPTLNSMFHEPVYRSAFDTVMDLLSAGIFTVPQFCAIAKAVINKLQEAAKQNQLGQRRDGPVASDSSGCYNGSDTSRPPTV